MLAIAKNLYDYREPMATLGRKNIAPRHKQACLGIAWARTGCFTPFCLINFSIFLCGRQLQV
jgi:ABC-type polysaccharide/polyol phosphate export permease